MIGFYFDTAFNATSGKPLTGVEVSVLTPSNMLAVLYADANGTPGTNPVISDENGLYGFYVEQGSYRLELRYAGVLYLTIPVVNVGGQKGEPGLTAYQVWLAAGNIGTEADYIASLTGPRGGDGAGVGISVLNYQSLVVNNDWSAAINAALAQAGTVAGVAYLPGRSQPYICKDQITVPARATLRGDGLRSVIRRAAGATNTVQVLLGTDAVLTGVQIDGQAGMQTVECYGVLGYRVERPRVSNTLVIDTYGIGVGWSECAYGVCDTVTVLRAGFAKQGFWNDAYTDGSFYRVGSHSYINCTALDCQLDGLSIGTDNNTVSGGFYLRNGYGAADYMGALGAAGIFSLDDHVLAGVTIINTTCNSNTEFGINVAANGAVISANTANDNQLAGMLIKGGVGGTVSNNVCEVNGWYTGSINPDYYERAGIVWYPEVSNYTFSSNLCQDNRPPETITQRYGLFFASLAYPLKNAVSQRCCFVNNNTTNNKIAPNNFEPTIYSYPTLGSINYKDWQDTKPATWVPMLRGDDVSGSPGPALTVAGLKTVWRKVSGQVVFTLDFQITAVNGAVGAIMFDAPAPGANRPYTPVGRDMTNGALLSCTSQGAANPVRAPRYDGMNPIVIDHFYHIEGVYDAG